MRLFWVRYDVIVQKARPVYVYLYSAGQVFCNLTISFV